MNLGNLLRRLDRLDEAIACHRRALALEPRRHEARFNLANALAAKGERDEAARCYREVVAARPDFADSFANLAPVLLSDRAGTEADELIARLLARDPRSHAALMLLARRRIVEERWAEAEAALRHSLEAGAADDADAQALRGLCRFRLGDAAGAVEAYRRSLAIAPDLAAALNGLGVALQALGDLGAGSEALRAAARRRPEDSGILTNLGSVLVARGEVDEGIALLRKSTGLDPTDATAFSNLGNALFLIGHLSDAVTACEAAVRLKADYADAYSNLGIALGNQGRLAEATAAFERALVLDPDHGSSFSNRLFLGNYDSDIAPAALAELHRGFGRRHESAAVARHEVDRDPGRTLRVGYVSPDFRQHSVAYFAEPLLAAHDPDLVEVTCYAAVKKRDDVTERLQSRAGGWRNILGMSDAAAADCIRADRIDILVDLAGHTAGNRLGVFARRPAPVQATYIGYPNTTGLTRVDYRLTDASTDPPGEDASLYAERLYRLPRCFLAYRPPPEAPPVAPRPGSAAGHVTFGSFNALTKVNPRTVATWATILQAVPTPGSCSRTARSSTRGRRRATATCSPPTALPLIASILSAICRSAAGISPSTIASTSRSTPFPTTARQRPARPCGWECRSSHGAATATPAGSAQACSPRSGSTSWWRPRSRPMSRWRATWRSTPHGWPPSDARCARASRPRRSWVRAHSRGHWRPPIARCGSAGAVASECERGARASRPWRRIARR